ncbi:MAG: 30S ribosomal protein S3 [bacterium]
MGNKINANGFRISVNKGWNSRWFATTKDYKTLVHEDIKVRKVITDKIKNAGIHRIEIVRSSDKVIINLTVGKPGVVIGRAGKDIEVLKAEVAALIGKPVQINIHEVQNPYLSSALVVQNIIEALEKRVLPKVIMAQQLEKVNSAGALGVKIWVSGIGKNKQVGTEKKEAGRVPLTTLRANIDFAMGEAQIKAASERKMGVKVWIYLGEKLGYE